MITILIPVFDGRVSSRLDCAEYLQIIKIENKLIREIDTTKIIAKNSLEKLSFILSYNPDIVICNGLTEFYKNELDKHNIEILPWIHGDIEEIVNNFLKGKLYPKTSGLIHGNF